MSLEQTALTNARRWMNLPLESETDAETPAPETPTAKEPQPTKTAAAKPAQASATESGAALAQNADAALPSDPDELQHLIDTARRVTPSVLRAARAVQDLEQHAREEIEYLRGAPASFIEPGIGVITSAAQARTGEDAAYLGLLTRALLEEGSGN